MLLHGTRFFAIFRISYDIAIINGGGSAFCNTGIADPAEQLVPSSEAIEVQILEYKYIREDIQHDLSKREVNKRE